MTFLYEKLIDSSKLFIDKRIAWQERCIQSSVGDPVLSSGDQRGSPGKRDMHGIDTDKKKVNFSFGKKKKSRGSSGGKYRGDKW